MTGAASGAAPKASGALARDGVWITLGHVAFALGQFAIAAAIAKLAGVQALAAFGLALAVGGPVYFLANLGLRSAIARDAARGFGFGDYWRLRVVATGVAALAMAAAALAFGGGRGGEGVAALLLFAWVKTADAGFDVSYGLMQRDGAAREVARSLFWRATLGPAGCVAGLVLGDGALAWGLAGWAVAATALFWARDAGAVRAAVRREPARAGAAAVARVVWPLGVAAALASLGAAIPRVVVDLALPAEALGYFTAIFLFFQAALVVASALGSAATPHLAAAHAAGDARRFARLTVGLAAVGVAAGLAGTALAARLGPWLLATLYTDAYTQYTDILIVLMAAAGFRVVAAFLQTALVAAGRFKRHMAVHLVLAALALAAAPPLIAVHGLAGAGYAILLTAAAQALIAAVLVARARP